MFEPMEWKDAYGLWKLEAGRFIKVLSCPLQIETVHVDYDNGDAFYGYDWLENDEVQRRRQLIQEKPTEFLYFTTPSNRGTIQTATMLAEAQSEEELAAIWIASTAKEIHDLGVGKGVSRNAMRLQTAAEEFLKSRYTLWHPAMKRLVPEISIPLSVLDSINCEDAEPVMGLIQINVQLLKHNWRILRYSSLEQGTYRNVSYRLDG